MDRQRKLDLAFDCFSAVCDENPEFAMAYYKRGRCYMMMLDYEKALYDFSAAILNETRSYNKQPYGQSGVKYEGGLARYYMCGG